MEHTTDLVEIIPGTCLSRAEALARIRAEQEHQAQSHGLPQGKTPGEWAQVLSGWSGLLQVELLTSKRVAGVTSSRPNSSRSATITDAHIQHRLVEIAATAMSALEQGWT